MHVNVVKYFHLSLAKGSRVKTNTNILQVFKNYASEIS